MVLQFYGENQKRSLNIMNEQVILYFKPYYKDRIIKTVILYKRRHSIIRE